MDVARAAASNRGASSSPHRACGGVGGLDCISSRTRARRRAAPPSSSRRRASAASVGHGRGPLHAAAAASRGAPMPSVVSASARVGEDQSANVPRREPDGARRDVAAHRQAADDGVARRAARRAGRRGRRRSRPSRRRAGRSRRRRSRAAAGARTRQPPSASGDLRLPHPRVQRKCVHEHQRAARADGRGRLGLQVPRAGGRRGSRGRASRISYTGEHV